MADLLPEATSWTVGDRQVAFTALLPEPDGPVLVAVGSDLESALLARFPGATPVEWDGGIVDRHQRSEIPRASAALVVADARIVPPEALRPLVAPDGTLAVLGPHGDVRVHPSLEHPEVLWRPGWPVSAEGGPARRLRRGLALRLSRPGPRPRLEVHGEASSIADEVADDVAAAVGAPLRLAGVVTAGHTVLRLRGPGRDLAVRLTLTRGARTDDVVDRVAGDVPGLADHLPAVEARGTTRGHDWVASRWISGSVAAPTTWLRGTARRQAAVDGLVDRLAAHPTGRTAPGWAADWCASAPLLPTRLAERAAALLRPLEYGVPTSWCHGDLWPGNVLLDRRSAAVIDWDNAMREAPQGLDRVLLAVLGPGAPRRVGDPGDPVCGRLLALVDLDGGPGAPRGEILGRDWAQTPRELRLALAAAACVLYLRNRSMLDLGEDQLDRELTALAAALPPDRGEAPGAAAAVAEAGAAAQDQEARRTARGALWLGTSSLVVKTSQTTVLLILAALLAPEALGLVALGTLVANIAAILANLGTANALVYWRGDVHRAARTSVTVALVGGGLLAGVLWLLAPWLADTFRADGGAPVIRGLTAVLPCVAVAAVTGELLRRRLAFRRRIVPDVVASLVGAAAAITLAFEGYGVMSLVVGQVVQGVLTLLVAWLVHPPVLPGWNTDDARGLLSYGGPLSGAQLLELVQLNLDYLFVSRALGALALGLYSLAFRMAYLPHLMIVLVVTGAAFPYLCRRRGTALGGAAEQVAVATLTLVTPLCLGLALFADHLVVLGERWEPAVPVVAVLAGYPLLLGVSQLVMVTMNASGRPALTFQLRLVHLLGLLVALPVAVRFGIVAVAVAQLVVAGGVAALACVYATRHVPGLSLRRLTRNLRFVVLGAVAMATVVLLARNIGSPDPGSLLDLLVRGLVGLTAYVLVVGALDREGTRTVVRLLGRSS